MPSIVTTSLSAFVLCTAFIIFFSGASINSHSERQEQLGANTESAHQAEQPYSSLNFYQEGAEVIFNRPPQVSTRQLKEKGSNQEHRSVSTNEDVISAFENGFADGKDIWQRMEETNTPGVAVAAVVDNKIAWSKGYGEIKAGSGIAVEPTSLFQAASISKPVTTIGVLKMIRDTPNLTLDTNLLAEDSSFLPKLIRSRWCLDLPDTFQLTLRKMLIHRSGIIGRGRTYPHWTCRESRFWAFGGGYSGYHKFRRVPTLEEIIDGKSRRLGVWVNSPETQYTYDPATLEEGEIVYSGASYVVLQSIIEKAAPNSFSNWMEANVLIPMNMTRSHFTHDMYERNSTWKARYFDDNSVTTGHYESGRAIWGDRRQHPEYAAAGMYTTAEDLSKLIITLNNDGIYEGERIFASDAADAMINGLGLFVGTIGNDTRLYLHDGANAGYRAVFLGFPDINTGVTVLINSEANTFLNEILVALLTAYDW